MPAQSGRDENAVPKVEQFLRVEPKVLIEALRATYETINRGDWDPVYADVHSDFELNCPDHPGDGFKS